MDKIILFLFIEKDFSPKGRIYFYGTCFDLEEDCKGAGFGRRSISMKMDIRRRMRLVALSGGVLSFAGLLLIVCVGVFLAGGKVTERRNILAESASSFVGSFAGEQTRRRLSG